MCFGWWQDGSIHIVLEYMDRGSLTELIHDWRDLEYGEDLMAAITIQVSTPGTPIEPSGILSFKK